MNESYSVKNIIKFLVIVMVVIVIFYFITVLVSKNKSNSIQSEDEITVIQYEDILLGNIFDMPENEFYILIQNEENLYLENYKAYITTYEQKEDALKFYTVNLDSAFNKRYIGEENNFEKGNLKVKGVSLLKIKDKQIVESYTDNNSITEKLKEIAS